MKERIKLFWLVFTFAIALLKKLYVSESKYKWNGSWQTFSKEMLLDCLYQHIDKGDPRDAAAYCAFAWYRKLSLKQ